MMGTVHEVLSKFIKISRQMRHKTRNVSDKNCRENQNARYMFSAVFLKIVLFMG